ncbi:hypothetical protein [Proteiniphilum sp. UBA5431]|jgi:hypothetical protein|uniref:hypothetical protein n=1 Tax=Proteiniphilum sp. UBA5431 TaxID=1947280 RepID=UPI002580E524|nr:hypothetical protein [Proteiniphilum sp. UBA5431]
MKTIKQSFGAVIIGTLLFSGCTKEPFEGLDNYFLEFSLQSADKMVYEGKITDNVIEVSMPKNLEMDKLTAKYMLSELATIDPKPETIKEWSGEQRLTVTSYNGTKRDYKVKILKEDVVLGDNVFLQTDEEVDVFAKKKINIINGNLIIGAEKGTDSISNIDALNLLNEIKYKLIVNPTFKGDLKPLQNLRSVGGIMVNGEPKQLKEIVLPNLQYLFEDFISRSNNISKISFDALTSAGNITVKSTQLAEFSAPRLERAGQMSFSGKEGWSEVDVSTIKEISFPNLQSCKKLDIKNLLNLETIDLEKLENAGDVNIANLKMLSLLNMGLMKTANKINVERCEELKDLKIALLKSVNDRITISNCPNLENISTTMLEEVNQYMGISECPKITSIDPLLSHLKLIGNIRIYKIPHKGEIDLSGVTINGSVEFVGSLADVTKIKLPKLIQKTLELNFASDPSITQLPLITGLEECENFRVQNAPGITEIVLPASLKKISNSLSSYSNVTAVSGENLLEAGEISISSNELASMSFPNLEKVIGKLSLFGKFLEAVYLPKLTSVGNLEVGGSWSGWQNEKLTDLSFLAALTSVEKLEIKFCKFLTDFSGLKKAVESGSITEKKWNGNTVHDNAYNPTFEDLKAGRYVKP